MADDHDGDRPAYDPNNPTPPAQEPPYRSTAPQSAYTTSQVAMGWAVAIVGLVLTIGLPVLAA
ncbi:hypothetical protein Hrd1104_02455 [Halorhabdus sp. CBA1104]|uniref:DUF7550 family protein n=1 Tax=unclassified Halorhabdus TaxID=2621901 RepID=UPI0012B21D81|nr:MULTISPECIES: hypothetical protein [unclassified Halorhabdus]QGN06262.1 hypothetical protein Hrd1104_02455 [Halorhabdus sp. CBA1104]